MKHYVYRITNIKLNKHYYGTRTTKLNPSEDIGYIYFSSSSDKEFIQDQKNNPLNYKYKVVRIFSDRKQALELEVKLHQKFNVGINESFYNRSKQTSIRFDTTGNSYRKNYKCSEETKLKISESNKGKKPSKEAKKKMSEARIGMKFTKQHKLNLSKARKNYKCSEETKLKMSESHKDKKHSKEVKKKMSETRKKLHITITSKNNPLIFRLIELYDYWILDKNISYYKFEKKYKLNNNTERILNYFKKQDPKKDKVYIDFISSFQVS